jgi:hypothetical protein
MMQGLLTPYRPHSFYNIFIILAFFMIFVPAPALVAEPSVESYFWPPGFFLHFGKLKQAQKEIMLSEAEKKVAYLRQTGKGLLVRGDLMDKVRTDISEFNPATILDQSGLIVLVGNFPNIYFNFNGPDSLISRNTFIVVKNPRVDRMESIIRQSLVMTGDFFAFSQAYFKATVENLQKALKAQSPQNRIELQETGIGKKRKKP